MKRAAQKEALSPEPRGSWPECGCRIEWSVDNKDQNLCFCEKHQAHAPTFLRAVVSLMTLDEKV